KNGDGNIKTGDDDKAYVVIGMRRGGQAYYALDVSNPQSPAFLWRLDQNSAGFAELGQTWSTPVVTRIPGYKDVSGIPKPVIVFSGGYAVNKDASGVGVIDAKGRALYIADLETGALVWSISPHSLLCMNLSTIIAPSLHLMFTSQAFDRSITS
ncbi:MAG: hypothetical protein GY934_14565, partial [Gammaproteobacteria bacterium]|nr:hypothetical protein [Gammaproteobacteria bacterium]